MLYVMDYLPLKYPEKKWLKGVKLLCRSWPLIFVIQHIQKIQCCLATNDLPIKILNEI